MKFAAFFRNTNLGRPGAPTRAQLEAAFEQAGAIEPSSFQSNGTLVFDAPSAGGAEAVLASAAGYLGASCGLAEPGCVRSLAVLARLPTAQVFAGQDPAQVYEFTLSFACAKIARPLELPLRNARGDVELLWLERGNALSLSRKLMSSPGSPNRLLEQLSGIPFTSRSLSTIERLLARHA